LSVVRLSAILFSLGCFIFAGSAAAAVGTDSAVPLKPYQAHKSWIVLPVLLGPFRSVPLSQADTRAAAILINKLNATRFERQLYDL
jgi:hypothetical protein